MGCMEADPRLVALDCEMCTTAAGFELIRMTLVNQNKQACTGVASMRGRHIAESHVCGMFRFFLTTKQ